MCRGSNFDPPPTTSNPSTAALRYRRGVGILKGGLNENTTDAELLEKRQSRIKKKSRHSFSVCFHPSLRCFSPPVCQWWIK